MAPFLSLVSVILLTDVNVAPEMGASEAASLTLISKKRCPPARAGSTAGNSVGSRLGSGFGAAAQLTPESPALPDCATLPPFPPLAVAPPIDDEPATPPRPPSLIDGARVADSPQAVAKTAIPPTIPHSCTVEAMIGMQA